MWLTLLTTAALAAPVSLGRVDLLSEAPGTWLHDEAVMFGVYATAPGLRFAEQLTLVWSTPVEGLTVQTSLATQSVDYEGLLTRRGDWSTWWHWGLQTRLLVPTGWMVGFAGRWRWLRVGAGLSVVSGAGWGNLRWEAWRVLPTLGVGVGRSR